MATTAAAEARTNHELQSLLFQKGILSKNVALMSKMIATEEAQDIRVEQVDVHLRAGQLQQRASRQESQLRMLASALLRHGRALDVFGSKPDLSHLAAQTAAILTEPSRLFLETQRRFADAESNIQRCCDMKDALVQKVKALLEDVQTANAMPVEREKDMGQLVKKLSSMIEIERFEPLFADAAQRMPPLRESLETLPPGKDCYIPTGSNSNSSN